MVSDNYVGILYIEKKEYPKREQVPFWFRPCCVLPEFEGTGFDEISKENHIYEGIRDLFKLYEMDLEHFGTVDWNPLGEIIRPGETVLLKPNLVMDHNQSNGGTDCLYTQAAVTAPVIDYVIKAVGSTGKIIVGDAPMQECNFEKLVEDSGYSELIQYYKSKKVNIEIVDFRGLVTDVSGTGMTRTQHIREDVEGVVVDLKNESAFATYDDQHLERMRITNYNPLRLKSHHSSGKHEYNIAKKVLEADVIINLPKPKTHRKAGYTAAMKNIVGINVRKEYLPHHSNGSIKEGGDEHKKKSLFRNLGNILMDRKNVLESEGKYAVSRVFWLVAHGMIFLTSKLQHDVREGNWCGNNTISKTIVDLNRIVNYCDKTGKLSDQSRRTIFTIADMVVSGEKEGPVAPSPKPIGALVIAKNSFAADCVIGTMMGADIERMPFITDTKNMNTHYNLMPLAGPIKVLSNSQNLNQKNLNFIEDSEKWHFIPVVGWKEVFK